MGSQSRRWAIAGLLGALTSCVACGDGGALPQTGIAEALRADAASITSAPSVLESRETCPGEVSPSVLGALLRERRFDGLEKSLVELHRAYEREPACEVELMEGARALAIPANLELLDAFVAFRPDAWVALALRGGAYVQVGLVKRGTAFARDVTEAQWAGMNEAFASASADLERSLASAPANLIAANALLHMAWQRGDHAGALRILAETLERHPLSYTVRASAMNVFSPYYGGSYEAMAAIADRAQAHAERNPRLRGLPSIVIAIRAQVDRFDGKLDQAVAGYRQALAYLPHRDYYRAICGIRWGQGDYAQVAEVAGEWLGSQGASDEAHAWRGMALWHLGRLEEARADLDRAVELNPLNTWALSNRGSLLAQLGEAELAIRDFRRHLELDPGNRFSMQHLSTALMALPDRADEAEAVLRTWAESAPDDLEPRFQLAKLFHDRGDPRAAALLREYVARAGDDGRESTRLAQAKRLLAPPHSRRLPGLELLGLVSSS